MISLKEWLELIDYSIKEGWEYGWTCFGSDAYSLESNTDDWASSIVFDKKDQTIYQVEIHDYVNNRSYRMINPEFLAAHNTEAKSKGVDANQAWDQVSFTDLDVLEDFMQKAQAIISGNEYDSRVSVPLDIPDEELLKYMLMAHERDMTFNQYVEEALKYAIEEHNRDPEGFRARAELFRENN